MLIACVGVVDAQPDVLWMQTYGGEEGETFFSGIQVDNEGYGLAGCTESFGAGSTDFWFIRTDVDGDSLWSCTYGGENPDVCRSLVRTDDGGFALAGNTRSFGAGSRDFWLVRTDSDGDSLWSRTYGGERLDQCNVLLQTADDGFALGGCTESFGVGRGFWLVRTNADGDSLWSRTYGRGSCHALIQTADGGFALAGTMSNGFAILLVKTDEDGDSLWSQTFERGNNNNGCSVLIQTTDGGFALAGRTGSDFWLARTTADGDFLWSGTYGGGRHEGCEALIQTADEGFVMGGYKRFLGGDSIDIRLVRTDAEGNLIWSQTYGDENDDRCNFLIQKDDGGFVLAGKTDSFGNGGEFLLIETGRERTCWKPLSDIVIAEDDSVFFEMDSLLNQIYNPYVPDSSLFIEVQNGENLFSELTEEGLRIRPRINWNGIDSLRLIVTDPDDIIDTTYLRLTALPVNDLPNNFRLLLPENDIDVDTSHIFFAWQQATQNEWEFDEVHYNLHFWSEEGEWEVENLSVTTYGIIDIEALTDSMRIDLDQGGLLVEWWVSAVDDSGYVESDDIFTFFIPPLNAQPNMGSTIPREFHLFPAYPNPFNSTTTITYGLPVASNVSLKLFDLSCRLIQTLVEGERQAGVQTTILNAADLLSGLYFVRLSVSGHVFTRKVMLVR